ATGIRADTVTVTANAGTIQATATDVNSNAILAIDQATINNLSGGKITGGATGIHAGTLDVTNAFGATISGKNVGIEASARFHGNVGQVFGEIGYGMAFGSVAVEPLAGLAYVHV